MLLRFRDVNQSWAIVDGCKMEFFQKKKKESRLQETRSMYE